MQQIRSIVSFFTIVLIIVCVYQLSFTVVTSSVESKAETFAKSRIGNTTAPAGLNEAQKTNWQDSIDLVVNRYKRAYLDSIQNNPVLNLGLVKYTYKDCRDQQLSLGLDLKGGMSLLMEISEDDVLRSLSYNSPNATFNQAIINAKKAQEKESANFLDLFQREFEKLDKNAKLAGIFASVEAYQGKLNFNSTNNEVIAVLKTDMESAVQNTFQVLKQRIDQFGVASPNISLQANTGRIILELPGVDDPSRVRKILQQTAQLEFWNTYEVAEVAQYFEQANEVLKGSLAAEKKRAESGKSGIESVVDTAVTAVSNDTSAIDNLLGVTDTVSSAVNDTAKAKADTLKTNPIFDIAQFNVSREGKLGEGPVVLYALGKDTAKLNSYFGRPEVRAVFPNTLRLLWGAKPIEKNSSAYALFAIQINPTTTEAPLAGDAISSARQSFDQQGGTPEVSLTMNSVGASTWEKMTEAAVNANVGGQKVKKCIAIVLDNRVFSAPRVQNKIAGGQSQITGLDDLEEAKDLANILNSGKLEAKTRVIEETVIGPSLGKESIRSGLLAMLIGIVAVVVFMIAYYSTSGVVADIAVLLNLFLILGTLASMGASLTLPGMAGIVLTIGIAVDANVIINERIREELKRGKGIRLAVEEGYKHSYSAIIDSNLTTLIMGIVLLYFGLGPVKGFATVLVIGIFTTLFTAVLVSHLLFDWGFSRNVNFKFGNKFTMDFLTGFKFDFMGKRKLFYGVSGALFAISFAAMVILGFDLGVDFKGGRSYVVKFDRPVTTAEVQKALEGQLSGNTIVKTYGSSSQVQITTAYMVDSSGPSVDSIIENKIFAGVAPFYSEKQDFETFRARDVKSSIKIEATVAADIRNSAFFSGIFGTLGVFLYILFRFRRWQYATGAIAALVHDPVLVLGVFALFKRVIPFSMEVDQTVVAAILTLIGYSINDTVVVFDRIREFIGLYPTRPLAQNMNDAINTTLSRTVMTSVVTSLSVLVLFIFGGEPVRAFSFAMLIGIAVGTYSSIFVATPISLDLLNMRKNQPATPEKV
jgi:SecD/SecF fusion protein